MTDNNSSDDNFQDTLDVTTPTQPETTAQPEPGTPTPQPMASQNEHVKKSNKTVAKSLLIIVSILALLGLGIGGGMWIQNTLKPNSSSTSLTDGTDGNTTVTQEESSIASVVEKVNPSVVSILGTTQSNRYYSTSTGQSAGTGIIVSKDGYILTNNHVVQGASDISIVDSEGTTYTNVSIVGRDPLNDVAFLKVKSDNEFTPAELGNSSTLRIGQQVVAIGNALGQYSNTVTSGIVSGTGRPITAAAENGETETLTDLVQTDASINPGNSGGPLLNMSGQVIGINTAIVEDANGIGFAIPINSTKGILKSVLETGKVARAFLGVNFVTITPEISKQYNLSVKEGAYVFVSGSSNPVADGSPAGKAGLQKGDIITKINDTSLGQAGGLSSVIGLYQPGDTVTVTYLRDGQTKTTNVTFTAYSE